jgi:hypothetical protein
MTIPPWLDPTLLPRYRAGNAQNGTWRMVREPAHTGADRSSTALKESTVYRFHRFHHFHLMRRTAGLLAGLAAVLLAYLATSPAAFAMRVPSPDTTTGPVPAPAEVHTVIVGGMPGWQISLITIVAALATAAVAVLLDRARVARHRPASAA